jgi:MFS family permease
MNKTNKTNKTNEIKNINKIDNTIRIKRNIPVNYLYHFLMEMNVTSGIWMIFLAFKGLNLFQIGIMESIFHITSFTMEMPTGAIADMYGRKTSRMLSRVMEIGGILLMIFGTNVIHFGISFVLSALSYNLESGAGTALLYDSMKEIGSQKEYMKVSGRIEIIYQVGSVIALFVGGYLATIDYNLTFTLALILAVLSLLVTFFFTEPDLETSKEEKNLVNQIKTSFQVIKKDKRIAFFILCIEGFGVLVTTVFFYIQNYLKSIGNNEFEIGILLAIASAGAAVFAANAYKLEKKFRVNRLILTLAIIGTIGFVLIGLDIHVGIGMIGIFILDAGLCVILGDYINRLIPSKQRATILSIQSMVFSLLMILLFPLVGKIGDIFGLMTSFRIISGMSIALLVWLIIKLRNVNLRI